MRPLWKDVLTALWLGMIVPGIVLNAFVLKEKYREVNPVPTVQPETSIISGQSIPVQMSDGTVENMEPETYLTGVLLAEIPADFHEEALKAQSVAARTYTWKAFTTGGKHGDGRVCTESSCCQAYIAGEAFLALGGRQEQVDKVNRAIHATSGMVLAYNGALIEATYFSSSGGSTEAAAAVWGSDFPYLQAVSSPEADRIETVVFSFEEFRDLLGISPKDIDSVCFGGVTYTDGGGVDSMEICGTAFSGTQLRSLLNLPSTVFRIAVDEGQIAITSKGYGHRVGMSQYGANSMAESGSTWQEILQHYYPGTTLYPAY